MRGAKSGEKRLVAMGSVGIGGHINDNDESLFSFDRDAYRVAVHREIEEELRLDGAYEDRIAALINDDSTEVGRVHLGVVHLVALNNAGVRAGEKAIADLRFLSLDELKRRGANSSPGRKSSWMRGRNCRPPRSEANFLEEGA